MDQHNPFARPSTLPFQLPPYAAIRDEHYRPAFLAGMAEQLAKVEAICSDPAEPSVDNTLLPLERSGQLLDRVAAVFFNRSSSDSSPFTIALEEELAPLLAAHSDAIRLRPELFARIAAVHSRADALGLDPETRYLLERHFTQFTLAGAGLSDADKALLRDFNTRLSVATTRFEKNLLADTNDLALVVDDAAELDGLSAGQLSAAAQVATDRGLPGRFVITLVLFTGHPYLALLTNRGVRERLLAASRARGIRGGEHDNRALVLSITRLRAERARLLGFATHAAAVTADETARTPAAVGDLLHRLAVPAARNARAEQAELQALVDADVAAGTLAEGFEIAAWDWAFYSERLRRARYEVDTAALRPWFELESVLRDGVFYAAQRLYGVTFTERPSLAGWHPDARVFEVCEEDGSPVGLYILDVYTRDSKRGGAWMNALVSQSDLLGTPVIVCNNLNVPQPADGEATLLSLDEVTTLFHEFGHALHGLFARVTYPKFSGTNVYRDFVEFPSQVNEMWRFDPEVLANYAHHRETGEPLPPEVVAGIHASETFNEGFATSEYLAAALLDQAWHGIEADAGTGVEDVAAFEAACLEAAGLDNPAVPTRYASTYFAHTFSGGYDAGYYSYIWSEVQDADTGAWFAEHGGLTRENGERFRERLLARGGSVDPLEAYRDFRGRDAIIQPLLDRRGLN
ncbi:M3 family metallopeptidase [Cryobacterium zhongshanensis]|uniref:M3 family metallopeptidase n=1 Tax=Cryobacterium zhongshanensis TaxID=2928153 RepID=A0AA41UJX8_9MICO|nr:M3 family metallopeptidase [Cryobacterium zhongshanensis]MCI4657441.1 M3 family metallopeptidase [Cryobacterium zhongshanensis]